MFIFVVIFSEYDFLSKGELYETFYTSVAVLAADYFCSCVDTCKSQIFVFSPWETMDTFSNAGFLARFFVIFQFPKVKRP